MIKRLVAIAIISLILFPTLIPTSLSDDEIFLPGFEDWSFRKEVKIPINTSDENAKYQPIDIQINFNNSCWVKDENEHSIRVIFQDGDEIEELESQIYDMNFSNENFIISCNLVFLIPEFATGNEKYYVIYDDDPKPSPGYEDRVQIEDGYSHYEPFQGLYYESWYYEINQDDNLIYGISKEGIAVDYPTVQQVAVMKPGATNTLPKNGEFVVDLNFKYWYYTNNKWNPIFCEIFNNSDILIDGNLMVKCAIISNSKDDSLQSTVYYKYYYTPHEDKRLYTHILHEIKKYPLPTGDKIDFGFATLRYSKTVSNIDDLNVEGIPPYLHYYSESDEIKTYYFDTAPESPNWVRIIGPKDEADLGKKPWISSDYGETGKATSFIFESNEIVDPKFNIRDGINIRLFEKNVIPFPVDISLADIYIVGNTHETGEDYEKMLPKDFKLEFNAEIFTTQKGGYKKVEQEAEIYQNLVGFQPENDEEINGSENEQAEFTVSGNVFLPESIKLEILSSKLLLNDAHINAIIFKDGKQISQQRISRIKFTNDFKIDWKNISLFNKFQFENLKSGKYLIKVFLENTVFDDGEKFIGYEIIDVQNNVDINIFCKPEGKIELILNNQYGKNVKDSEIHLIKDNIILCSNNTDEEGRVIFGVPSGLGQTYQLKIYYDGFLVTNEEINLGQIRMIIPLRKKINFNLSNFSVSLKNTQGLVPDVNVNMYLTSDEMNKSIEIYPDYQRDGSFKFLDLYHANYTLIIEYFQFKVQKEIIIPENKNITITLYDFSIDIFDAWDQTFEASLDVKIKSLDLEKNIELKATSTTENGYTFSNIYPGNYVLKISFKSNILEQNITIPDSYNNHINIKFPIKLNVTTKVYDSHGNPLKDAKIKIGKNNANDTGVSNDCGVAVFSLPPGFYETEVYISNDLVAKRKVDILNENVYMIVTNHDPIIFFLIIGILIIALTGTVIYCIKKRNSLLFLELLVVIITLMSVVMPWWNISGNSTEHSVETSTNLYLIPGKMVSFTSSNTNYAGEFIILNETFNMAIYYLMLAILIGAGLIFLKIVLKKLKRKKISNLIFALGAILIVFSTIGFFYGISIFSDILTGTCTNQGGLEVAVPGEETYYSVSCTYGPNIGFYLILISSIIIIIISLVKIKTYFKNRRVKLK